MVNWMNQKPDVHVFTAALRSGGVGLVATASDVAALSGLVVLCGLSPRAASVPALALGVGIQFVGNKLFAFRDRSRAWGRQAALFLCVESLGFAANLALFDLAATHVALPLAVLRLATTSLVYFALCLPLWSLVFRQPTVAAC